MHPSIKSSVASAALAAAFLSLVPASRAAFVVVDTMQGYAQGTTINGQGGWSSVDASNVANAGVTFAVDPLDSANTVIRAISHADNGSTLRFSKALPASIANGATGTLFYQVYFQFTQPTTTVRSVNIGLADVTPSAANFANFETQVQTGFSNRLLARAGGSTPNLDTVGGSDATIAAGVWYSFWQVVDNSTDTYSVYVQGGSGLFQNQTLLMREDTSVSALALRNGTTDALTHFISIYEKANMTGVYFVDNIYVDAGAMNLINPTAVPEPSTTALLSGLAALGAGRLRRRR